ncbi:MAG: hypothetical protein L0Z52_09545 [Acidobacteria bacterium]|nr:hypothetical protein [Acidobacteriota bacterium]
MKNTVKYLAILVVALTVSSALFAAPGGNNCSTSPTTDAAMWGGGGGHSVSTDAVNTNSSCKISTTANPRIEGGNDQKNGLANAFGKLIHTIGASIDTALWGGGGNYNPPPR